MLLGLNCGEPHSAQNINTNVSEQPQIKGRIRVGWLMCCADAWLRVVNREGETGLCDPLIRTSLSVPQWNCFTLSSVTGKDQPTITLTPRILIYNWDFKQLVKCCVFRLLLTFILFSTYMVSLPFDARIVMYCMTTATYQEMKTKSMENLETFWSQFFIVPDYWEPWKASGSEINPF